MSLAFGYENYLDTPRGNAPSDFEVHRAQQRHYDAWTSEHGRPGSLGAMDRAIAESQRSSGSSSGGSAAYIGPAPKPKGGHTILSGPDAGNVSPSDVEGGLNPVMEPDITRTKFGINWEPNPWFSDVETGAEQRYGDIGGAVAGIGVAISDAVFNLDRWVQTYHQNVVAPRRREIDAERERLIEENFFDPFPSISPPTFVTGGGF